jgi:hypothetical protein
MKDSVAQPVEHYTFNVGVLGSNPSGITENAKCAKRKLGIFVFTLQRQKLRFCKRRCKNKNNARERFAFCIMTFE